MSCMFLITSVDLFQDPGMLTEHCKKRNSPATESTCSADSHMTCLSVGMRNPTLILEDTQFFEQLKMIH